MIELNDFCKLQSFFKTVVENGSVALTDLYVDGITGNSGREKRLKLVYCLRGLYFLSYTTCHPIYVLVKCLLPHVLFFL